MKKNVIIQLNLLLSIGMLLCSSLVHANGIKIVSASTYVKNEDYYLNAKISYHFSEEAIEALQHGVALYFIIDIKTIKERKWIWDKTIRNSNIRYRLEYHPLSQRYLLTKLDELSHKDFRHLNSALDFLGDISNRLLISRNELTSQDSYYCSIRAKLDLQSLPAPLIPLAFVSTDWHLSSDWHKSVIQAGNRS